MVCEGVYRVIAAAAGPVHAEMMPEVEIGPYSKLIPRGLVT